jgi:branched-chain amino acid transport system permease protein
MKALKAPGIMLLGLLILGLIVNFGLNSYIQLMLLFILINCILAISLNLVNGYTGQFSLGHAGFMAVGAYFTAYASTHWIFLPDSLSLVSFALITIFSGVIAAAFGFLVGQPSLRLKGDYLAIVTLGFGEIIRTGILNLNLLGGARGYAGIPILPDNVIPGVDSGRLISYLYCAVWFVISFFVIWRVCNSSHGRAFLSIREDEIAAEAMGINSTQVKVRAFVMSSFFAGIAGSLFAFVNSFINAGTFTFLLSINFVIMVVLGGMGSMSGSIAAAIFITLLPEGLRDLQDLTGVDLRMVIYSLTLIIVMIVRPQGLFGSKEITDVWRRYVRRSP